MIYAENIYLCLVVPILVSALFVKEGARRFSAFLACGMTSCLLAAYCNSWFTELLQLSQIEAVLKLTPICEEGWKAIPVFLYILLFRPNRSQITTVAVAIGVGFATFENCCYIVQYGAREILFVMMRGLAAGAMHTVATAMVGYGVAFAMGRSVQVLVSVFFGTICLSSCYHAMYNILVSASDWRQYLGYGMPAVCVVVMLCLKQLRARSVFARHPMQTQTSDQA